MAHSHLATWKPALATGDTTDKGNYRTGGLGSIQRSRKDATGFTKIKLRADLGTAETADDLDRREQLEAGHLEDGNFGSTTDTQNKVLIEDTLEQDVSQSDSPVKIIPKSLEDDEDAELAKYDDKDDDVSEESDDDDSDDSDDDSDDEAALARELAILRKEPKDKEQREQAELEELEAKLRKQEAMLETASTATGATIKRRWDADVVFQNQARNEPAPKKRFINDTLRSDFQRKFLKKYIP